MYADFPKPDIASKKISTHLNFSTTVDEAINAV